MVTLFSPLSLDTYIQKSKKAFTDSRARRNLTSLNSELHDVQKIMVKNIDDVLQRGTVLSGTVPLNQILLYIFLQIIPHSP